MFNTPVTMINIADEINVNIHKTGDGFTIKWSDNVANEWRENYPTLSAALTRAAVLAVCGENSWDKSFTTSNPELFTENVNQFMQTQTV